MDLADLAIYATAALIIIFVIRHEYTINKSDKLFWERISSMEDHFAPKDETETNWKRIENEEKTK